MFHHLLSRRALGASLVLVLAVWPSPADAGATVRIDNMSYEADRHSVVLAISGPVTISTRSLKAPNRLVVDLPAATLVSKNRELVIEDALVKRVRMSQFKIIPPTVRVVIETAGDDEPVIAVQQTAKNLYITVARPGDLKQGDSHDHDHDHAPQPSPIATPSPIAPSPITTATPTPLVTATPRPAAASPVALPTLRPSPLVLPSVRPTPTPPVASVRPTPSPTLRPSPSPLPTPALRRTESGGEAGNESLPGMDD